MKSSRSLATDRRTSPKNHTGNRLEVVRAIFFVAILSTAACHSAEPGLKMRPGAGRTLCDFGRRVNAGAAGPEDAFAAGTTDGAVWVSLKGGPPQRLGVIHDGPVVAVAMAGDYLFSVGGKAAAFWHLPSRSLLRQVRGPQRLTAAILDVDGKTAIFGTEEGHVLRWQRDKRAAEPVPGFACAGSILGPMQVRLPEPRRCLYGKYVEPEKGPPMCAYPVTVLTLHRDTLLRACREGTLGFLDLKDRRQSWYLAGHLRTVTVLGPSLLLLGRAEGELHVYDHSKRKVVRQLFPSGTPDAAASNGEIVAVAQQKVLRFWATVGTQAITSIAIPAKAVWLGFRGQPLELRALLEDGRLLAYPLTVQR